MVTSTDPLKNMTNHNYNIGARSLPDLARSLGKSYPAVTRKMRRPQLIENKIEKLVPGVGVEPT
jgi:hypothetical protein